MGATGISSNISNGSKIDRTPFTNEGGGQWTIDIEGVGGASILDETDEYRFGGTAYGVTVWDKNYDKQGDTTYHTSLNAAKQAAKDRIKDMNK